MLCRSVWFKFQLSGLLCQFSVFVVNFDNAVRLLCLLYCVTDVVVSIMFCTCYFTLCFINGFEALMMCYTVRNQAELFRDKTGVVLSGRLSRPPGFVEFTAVCAPVLPLVGTVFVCNFDVALYWVIQLGQPIM